MRRSLFILLAAAALFVGCEPETYLFVDEKPLSFSSDGGSATIDLVANKDWTATSDNGWCTVSPSSGAGDVGGTRLTVKCSKNDSYDSRTATITVRCEDVMKQVSVSQSQSDALMISQKEFSLDEKGGTITITVQANVTYTCEVIEGSTWIVPIGAKGLSTQTRQFSIKENTSYDDREGRIRFSDSSNGVSDTVFVKQSRKGVIIIEKTEYELSYEAQSLEVSLLENTAYEVKISTYSQGWIKKVETKGLQTSSFTLSIEENEQRDREGVVYVTTSTDVITIKIKQADGILLIPDANTFPDANFRQYCIDNFDKNGDGVLSHKEAREVSRIDVKADEIESLQGLESFTNLKILSCSATMEWNSSHYLVVGQGQLTSLDVSKNTALTDLDCRHNQLTSLNVSKNTALERLDCSSNRLTSLDVSRNTALQSLSCNSNQLTSLDVRSNTSLTYLNCESNKLTSLDVSRNTALQSLYCYSNQLTSLDVRNNTSLTYFSCASNKLTSLDVSKNIKLRDLQCERNQLTSLDVSKNTSLTSLYCYSNQLTSLEVSRNTALTRLNCNSNKLTSLDVSKNAALTDLDCDNNQLMSLDVSNNTQLKGLSCYNNQLTSLDVSKNAALERLDCSSNLLIMLDVSSNPSLESLYCANATMIVLYLAGGQSFKDSDWCSGTLVQEGAEPRYDIYPYVLMTLSRPTLPYDLDKDTSVRITANNASTDVYYFVEKTEVKNARNLTPEAYADYVIANGRKLTMTPSSFDGAQVCDFVAVGLDGDNTLTAVAVSGGLKHMDQKTFFGVKWNTIATGSYTFSKSSIAERAGGATIPATLQQRDDQPGTYRFKDLYGPTFSLVFTILDGYVGEDGDGVYRYIRVAPQSTGLRYGSYGAVSVRDLGYWHDDDAYVTNNGYEGGLYDNNNAFLMVQYYVSAGSLGYGYDLFEAN